MEPHNYIFIHLHYKDRDSLCFVITLIYRLRIFIQRKSHREALLTMAPPPIPILTRTSRGIYARELHSACLLRVDVKGREWGGEERGGHAFPILPWYITIQLYGLTQRGGGGVGKPHQIKVLPVFRVN